MLSKRSFLKKSAGFLLGLLFYKSSLAKEWSKQIEKKVLKSSYYKAIFSRYHDWYKDTYFNFDKHLNSKEREYVATCQSLIPDWKYKVNQNVSLSYLTYSHRVKGLKVNSSRLACGIISNKELQNQMLKIIKQRDIKLPQGISSEYLVGLGWDFESDFFKYYYYFPSIQSLNQRQRDFIKKQSKQSFNNIHSMAIYSKTYKGNKEHEEKIYLYLKNKDYSKSISYPKKDIKNITAMITDKRGVVPQYDFIKDERDSNNHFNKLFNIKGQSIVRENEEYMRHARHGSYTVNYKNPNDFTLYFF